MPVYYYKAFNTSGKDCEGVIDAESPSVARQKLRDQNLMVVSLDVSVEQHTEKAAQFQFSVSSAEQLKTITQQWSVLLKAGISIEKAVEYTIRTTSHRKWKQILTHIYDHLKQGKSLSEALGRYESMFPSYYIQMIQGGEKSGQLSIMLSKLASLLNKQSILKRKITSSLAYPMLLTVVALCTLIFLMSFVTPNIERLFRQTRTQLPYLTDMLLKVYGFLSEWWIGLAVLTVIGVSGYRILRKTLLKYLEDSLLLRLPVIRTLIIRVEITRICQVLSIMLEGGLPLVEGIVSTARTTSNSRFREALNKVSEDIIQGESMERALSKHALFPDMFRQLLAAGEQSGNLDEISRHLATTYEDYLDNDIAFLVTLVEPAVIIIVGVVVGTIVLALLLPLLEMSNLVRM